MIRMKIAIKCFSFLLGLMLIFNIATFAQDSALTEFLFETGKKYYDQGDYEQALHELGKVLLVEPQHPEALRYIRLIEEKLGIGEEEIEQTQEFQEELFRQEAVGWALQQLEGEAFAEEVLKLEEEIDQMQASIEEDLKEYELISQGLGYLDKETSPPRPTAQISKPLTVQDEAQQEEQEEAPTQTITEKTCPKTQSLLSPESFLAPLKRFDDFIADTNEKIAPVKISGEYLLSLAATSEDIIWKEANGDYNETNWRRINEGFGINTYDRRIYDRLRVNIDTEKEQGFNLHSNITIDPWSFIGKTEALNIDGLTSERANIQFKYWSANTSIINETYLTLHAGAALNIPETKVVDGKTPAMTLDNTWDEEMTIPGLDVNREFWPIREFWVDYNNGDKFRFRFFPIAYQDQALTSDDPLQLSNHSIYWEESPWLDRWQPGIENVGANPVDFTKGEWEDDLSFYTRDSNMTRLTTLRGFSIKNQPWENLSVESTVASPKGLWQDYDAFDNIEGATRMKLTPTEELQLGLVSTFRYGLEEGTKDAENRVIAADISYKPVDDFQAQAEVAYSRDERDLTQEPYATKNVGNAYKFEVQKGKVYEERPEKWDEEAYAKETPFDYAVRFCYTHMDKGFYPALANYRITRKDPFWGRHIQFKQPYEQYYGGLYYPTLSWYDIKPYRIGDSVDIDRDVLSLRLEKAFLGGDIETLFDWRNAHEASSGKYIETVGRLETAWQANQKLLLKFLGIYHDLPKTTGGIDPILYDVDTNKFFVNSVIEDGKDPSLKTISGGLKYSFFDGLSFDFIYEFTNDFTVALDDYPRGLLNDSSFSTFTEDDLVWREPAPYLYSQGFFPTPAYPWFHIYKAGLEFEPNDALKLRLEFTKNDYKYASQVDDNINHLGLEAIYNITDNLALTFNYTYSKTYNLYQQTVGWLKYEGHHNVFVNLDYKMEDKGVFTLQFGEAAILPYNTMFTTSPYGGFLSSLDTAHILRAYFSRKF